MASHKESANTNNLDLALLNEIVVIAQEKTKAWHLNLLVLHLPSTLI